MKIQTKLWKKFTLTLSSDCYTTGDVISQHSNGVKLVIVQRSKLSRWKKFLNRWLGFKYPDPMKSPNFTYDVMLMPKGCYMMEHK